MAQRVQRFLHSAAPLKDMPHSTTVRLQPLPCPSAKVLSAPPTSIASGPAATAAASVAASRTVAAAAVSAFSAGFGGSAFVSRAALSVMGAGVMRRLAHTAASQPLWMAPLAMRRSVLLAQGSHPLSAGVRRTFFGSREGSELVSETKNQAADGGGGGGFATQTTVHPPLPPSPNSSFIVLHLVIGVAVCRGKRRAAKCQGAGRPAGAARPGGPQRRRPSLRERPLRHVGQRPLSTDAYFFSDLLSAFLIAAGRIPYITLPPHTQRRLLHPTVHYCPRQLRAYQPGRPQQAGVGRLARCRPGVQLQLCTVSRPAHSSAAAAKPIPFRLWQRGRAHLRRDEGSWSF